MKHLHSGPLSIPNARNESLKLRDEIGRMRRAKEFTD
ncbi:hypothetical protein J2Z31_002558 [Sinorhizobium kostiense]|uniref:Transposase n=1 Tax=Sinorhizobium kostiense TaxID=76747 RepID=A0ABS4R129_9HYPH|nr:hypothetical protein [Sinorhizobium kostiense]